ncbi:hypothetical protein ACFSNA_02915 [Pedobacter mendelii]|uniref:Uncharacterized protein n=1 Tax=Pedobacter jejuensis TaxID=1268550 RepID=A0A3N0BZG7_9SPHI|nr:hypothetical protein [Pedobacter jejuensis]RNL54747.1 hypothetical protein D7004_06380 [Pedobacter jejuensis]
MNKFRINYEAFEGCDDSSAELIYQLVRSGAKVKIQKRKSFALLKVVNTFKDVIPRNTKHYQYKTDALRQTVHNDQILCFGIANPGAIWLDKSEMIKLQLENNCASVSLLLYSENILADTATASKIMDIDRIEDGYLISGPICYDGSVLHQIRNINDLTIHLIL